MSRVLSMIMIMKKIYNLLVNKDTTFPDNEGVAKVEPQEQTKQEIPNKSFSGGEGRSKVVSGDLKFKSQDCKECI